MATRILQAKAADPVGREVLPIPDIPHIGFTTFDAKDAETKYPPIRDLRPPEAAPNILTVLIDDAGFGSTSAFEEVQLLFGKRNNYCSGAPVGLGSH